VLVGLAVWVLLPSEPLTAWWLTTNQREALHAAVSLPLLLLLLLLPLSRWWWRRVGGLSVGDPQTHGALIHDPQ